MHIARAVVEQAHQVVAVTDQRAGLHILPKGRDRRNALPEQDLRNRRAVAQEDRACRDDERLSLIHGGECAGIALFRLELDHAWLEPKLARRLGGRIGLFARRGVESDAEHARTRKRLADEFDAFGGELDLADEKAGDVAPGARERGYIALRLGVEIDGQKRDRLAPCGGNRGAQRRLVADGEEHVDLARGKRAIVLFVAVDIRRLDVVEGEVAAFLITQLSHAPEKVGVDRRLPRLNADKAEPQYLRLLRARRERPTRRAAEKGDELPPLHSITSSAICWRWVGTSRPSMNAVCALMMSSNLLDCTTGNSAGFAPLRMRPA